MSDERFYEYIVVGCGGIGSATLYWLSSRVGSSVLGLEQFKLGHANGGSQDHSRIIRRLTEDVNLTKLAADMFETWHEVEKESGLNLLHQTGVLDAISSKCKRAHLLQMYAEASREAGIPFEKMNAAEIRRRYPQFTFDDDVIGLFDAKGGVIDAALACAVQIQLARAHGATIKEQCPVTQLIPLPTGGCKVVTPDGVFRCRRVIVTSGAWINNVLGSVGARVPVDVTEENVTYFATPNIKKFTKERFPVFSYLGDDINLYSIPIHGVSGFKIGFDAGGEVVTPETRSFRPDPRRENALIDFLKVNLPEAVGPILETKTCLYTMTRDRVFVVDSLAHKGLPQVIVCCGAGHAFKWSCLLGKILSQLAVEGQTSYDISAFTMQRPAISDPNFKRTFHIGLRESHSKL